MAESGTTEVPPVVQEEAPSNGEGGGSWFGSFLSAAKNKSAEVIEFMKKDIDEFLTVVETEASSIASSTATVVKETFQIDDETTSNMKKSVSNFFGSVKEVLSPSPSTEFDEALIITDGAPVKMTRIQKKIHNLISREETFTTPIDSTDEASFTAWRSISEETLGSVERLTNLLASSPALQEKYTTLVPDQVSHSEFWERFLFRRALLEDREAEAERERKVAEKFPWEKVEDLSTTDLSEEEQIRILSEYDEEKNGRKKDDLIVREKKDMVIIGPPTTDMSQTSSSSKASTDGDWEKEFDIEESEEK